MWFPIQDSRLESAILKGLWVEANRVIQKKNKQKQLVNVEIK